MKILNEDNIEDLQSQLTTTLGHWGAFRNQGGIRNERFLIELFANDFLRNTFYDLFRLSVSEKTLSNILLFHKERISIIYSYFQGSILQNHIPASIMTISKTILMTLGISVGFDSRVLRKINDANALIKFNSGVWPFDFLFEALRYIASEQNKWELINGPMKTLEENLPICQIIDRILWTEV
ncbi:MAG: hypothetical protein QME58_01055 [Bacteroidota bacterium]|nr:hypothetical protein [Bacteroidota bacterium]